MPSSFTASTMPSFEAIADHDPERARLAMLEHLSVVDVKIDKILNAGSPS